MQQIFPGIWKLTLGSPEAQTPVTLRHIDPASDGLAILPAVEVSPISGISGKQTARGFQVNIPLDESEQIYGLGLQLLSFEQRGKKKTLRVNSDPSADLGDSHAPVPFYVTTAGYGVLVDTARYATFYCGSASPKEEAVAKAREQNAGVSMSTDELYALRESGKKRQMLVEIPAAQGVDVYIFGGPEMRTAVQRYNLFSGGGCLPPRWGLGLWYRLRADFNQQQVLEMAEQFRKENIPCDLLGLEPGWQTHAYPCTFEWSDKFPAPGEMIDTLRAQGFRLNLWTHAFIDPASPIFDAMVPHSGDYLTFRGLVPDLLVPQAREIFAGQHERAHVALGVSGYKLDECDNSDFISWSWSFPEISSFPSGLDGEQMHSLFGMQYQDTIWEIFRRRNTRTYSEVRSAQALAAPYPFVLYSDLYGHKEFIRGVVNCGFSGLLWSPEVRHADSAEDLIRRLQSVICSPQALINAWYIKNQPWKQWVKDENNADHFAENWQEVEGICRDLINLRMQLIPYLYAAFYRYATEGIPPFRALVMDYPQDENVRKIDDAYMMGESILVAPVIAGMQEREVYLPKGEWYDFWTNEKYAGSEKYTIAVPLERIPLFVKSGTVLPLAQPTLSVDDERSYLLTARVYGDGSQTALLIEDEDTTFAYMDGHVNRVSLQWDGANDTGTVTRGGNQPARYQVTEWQQVQ